MGISSLLLLLIAVPVAGQTAPPIGTWAQIPNTAIYPVMPAEAKTSTAPGAQPELWNPADVFAYSGGDLATLGGVLGFLFWGGGHAATPDNSLYWAPFDGSGPKRLSGPYLAPDLVYKYDDPNEIYRSVSRNAPSTVTVAAAPKSRHTYSNLVVVERNGRPYLFSFAGALYTGAGGGTGATRLFDLSLTYEQAMARPDMGWALAAPGLGGATSASCGWDPAQKRVVVRSKGFIGAYYPDENRWENWSIRNAPYGSDFEASVAMDLAGRKMYVIGDRLAEVIDLDTKAYTDLRSKPWAADFARPVWQGGYTNGPGIAWHTRTRQIVAWVNRNDPRRHSILLINPATGVVKTVAMGGKVITSPRSSAPSWFGRFRMIPGTDLVLLANEVNQDIYIGKVPFDSATPVPTPSQPPAPPPPPKGQVEPRPGATAEAPSTAPAVSIVVDPAPESVPVRDSQQMVAVLKEEKGRLLTDRNASWTKDAAECEATNAGWIPCDDFEKDRLGSYFEYTLHDGAFVRVPDGGQDR